jgi:hypothetical protein
MFSEEEIDLRAGLPVFYRLAPHRSLKVSVQYRATYIRMFG